VTNSLFSLIRRKTLSLIRNLYEIMLRQAKEAKFLLAALIIDFVLFMWIASFQILISQIVSFGVMVMVFVFSLKLTFFRKEKSDVPHAYRNLIPKE